MAAFILVCVIASANLMARINIGTKWTIEDWKFLAVVILFGPLGFVILVYGYIINDGEGPVTAG